MSEMAPTYHPVVEQHIETNPNSDDFGRVKDDELAYDVANLEQAARVQAEKDVAEGYRETVPPNAFYEIQTNKVIQAKLAEKAVSEVMSTLNHNLAAAGVQGEENADNVYGVKEKADEAVEEARKAAADYDVVTYNQALKTEARQEERDV